MKVLNLIHKYYAGQPELEQILLKHSEDVAQKVLEIAEKKNPDRDYSELRELIDAVTLTKRGIE